MREFQGKGAFITGGASGIGLGMARAFGAAGMKIAIADIEAGPLAAPQADLVARGVECITFELDVADRDAVKQAARETVAAFGKIHLLCNNAGVGGAGVPLDEMSDADWDWIIDVNLQGAINGLQAFLPLIKSHGEGGHIINTSSMSGLRVHRGRGQGSYNTTKFALVGLSEALVFDMEPHGIGVAVLCPGFVNTRIYESGRNRPERFGGPVVRNQPDDHPLRLGALNGMDADEFGERIRDAVINDEFYIVTDANEQDMVAARHARIIDAFDRVK